MSKPKNAVNSPMGQSASPQRQNPTYPKPTVPVALGEFLSPKQMTAAGLEVVVTYPSIKPGDVIALKFHGDDTFVPIEVENQTSVSFWVSVPHIIKALGTTVDIRYTLSGESAGQKSDILQLTVLPFMEGDLEMANVIEATEGATGVLDLLTFEGDAHILVKPWWCISEGQTIWLNMVSEAENLPILTAYPVTLAETEQGISRTLPRVKLDEIIEGAKITFPMKINFNETNSENDAYNFPTLELSVVNSAIGGGEQVEDFSDYSLGELPIPFINKRKQLYFTGTKLEIQAHPYTEGQELRVAFNFNYRAVLHLTEPCSKIKFQAGARLPFNAHAHYDDGGQQVHEHPGGSLRYENIFTRKNVKILGIEFSTRENNTLFLDDIWLYK